MNELIKITESENGAVVNAKELYLFLGLEISHWAKWCKRNIVGNQFAIENKDYVLLAQSARTKDYAFSIDFAKRISMMAKTEKGEEARQYFLDCESKANNSTQVIKLPTTYLEALKELVVKEETILLLEQKNEKLQFRSDFVDVCFDTDGVFSMEEVCKIIKLPYGRNTMLQKLRDLKVFLKSNTPNQKFISNGYFKVVEQLIDTNKFKKLVSTTYATQKGLAYIHKILIENGK